MHVRNIQIFRSHPKYLAFLKILRQRQVRNAYPEILISGFYLDFSRKDSLNRSKTIICDFEDSQMGHTRPVKLKDI